MPKSSRSNVLLFTALLILTLTFVSITLKAGVNQQSIKGDSLESYWVKPAISMNISDYTPISPVFIDDADPNYTWSKTAADNDWCNGSGTWQDPYVIEGVYIDRQGAWAPCIEIWNSDRYFIIRNCWINFTTKQGMYFGETENGQILNNIISYANLGMKFTYYSHNITVFNNYFLMDHTTAGLSRAIEFQIKAHHITVEHNYIYNCYDNMYIMDSYGNIIKDNFFENNIWEDYISSSLIFRNVSYSSIVNNIFAGAWSAQTFEVEESNCIGNVIFNNGVISETDWELYNSGPQLKCSSPASISLSFSHYNYIMGNKMLREGAGGEEGIPGYDWFLILGITSLICVVNVRKILKK